MKKAQTYDFTARYLSISLRGMLMGAVCVAAVGLSACDTLIYNAPVEMTQSGGIETYRDEYVREYDTASVGANAAADIAAYHRNHGETPLHLAVTYDPHSRANTAMKATQEAARIKSLLAKRGMNNIHSEIIPVQESGDVSRTLVSFDTLYARPSSECGDRYVDRSLTELKNGTDDYKMGCAHDAYFTRQIARPRDLHGDNVMDNSDGRRTSNAIEGRYRPGEMNAPLGGESASD